MIDFDFIISYRCGQKGHYIANCPQYVPMHNAMRYPRLSGPRIGHGIPVSDLVPADANTPGAVWTKAGYAVSVKDA